MRKLIYLPLLTSLLITYCNIGISLAQVDSPLGRFEVDYAIGCAPLTINITEKDNFGAIVRQYIYEEGLMVTNERTYTYNNPGTYDLVQIVQNEIPRTDTLRITVLEPRLPEFEIYSCPQNSARIDIVDDFYDFYRVYYPGSGGQPDSIDVAPMSVSDVINFTAPGVQNITVQGFINGAPPDCGAFNFNFSPISSFITPVITDLQTNQHCVNLVAAEIGLELTANVRHALQYSLNGTDFITLDTLFNTIKYSTTDIPSGTKEICFRLVALDECGETRIFSSVVCNNDLLIAMPAVTEADATFNTNKLEISWERSLIQPESYSISRSSNNGAFDLVGTTETNNFADIDARNISRRYEYRISAQDTCGNISSASERIRPVYLSATEISANLYTFILTDYLGWKTGIITYSLEVLDIENNLLESFPINENEFIRNIGSDADRYFRIRATDGENNRSVLSNTIILEQEQKITVPTAFSPNGDGLNDTFMPIISDAESFEMQIFNRWGELLFTSGSIFTGWDGRQKQGIVQSGTYIYQISLKKENGKVLTQRGTFQLIK